MCQTYNEKHKTRVLTKKKKIGTEITARLITKFTVQISIINLFVRPRSIELLSLSDFKRVSFFLFI